MKSNRTSSLAIGWIAISVFGIFGVFAFANAQSATTSVSTQLSPGDSGAQVSALQTFLATDPSVYPQGLVTGYYGTLTTSAVQAYQCKNGIVCQGDPTSTGYGNVGPATLAKIETQEGISAGGGVSLPPISDPSSDPPAGTDTNAPIVSSPIVVTSPNSATITWMTNEPATSMVMYSTVWPFLFASAPTAASQNGLSETANVTINGLQPNTTYYYVMQSVDPANNLQWSIDHSFTTNS